MTSRALLSVILTCAFCTAAEAQARPSAPRPAPPRRPVIAERVFFSAGVLFQVNSNDFTDTATIRRNAENGRLETAYNVGSGLAVDVSGSYLVWKNLACRSRPDVVLRVNDLSDSPQAPHPFLQSAVHGDGRYRWDRSEPAVHVRHDGSYPSATRCWSRSSAAPPSFPSSRTSSATSNTRSPTRSIPLRSPRAIAASQSESAVGVKIGGDCRLLLHANVGVGGTVQQLGETVEMTKPSGTAEMKAGGLQVGGGLRLRF